MSELLPDLYIPCVMSVVFMFVGLHVVITQTHSRLPAPNGCRIFKTAKYLQFEFVFCAVKVALRRNKEKL